MTHIQLCDVKNAKNALSEVGRAWVSAGKPRKGVIRDELVRADGRFRVAFCEYYNRRPRYELDSMGNVVILGHGPIYIDRGKITYGGRRAATATVVR